MRAGGDLVSGLPPCEEASRRLHAESQADAVWTVQGGAGGRGRGAGGAPRYFAVGAGVSPQVQAAGNTITVQGTLPGGFKAGDQIWVSASAQAAGAGSGLASRVNAQAVKLSSIAAVPSDAFRVEEGGRAVPGGLPSFSLHEAAARDGPDLLR